MVEGTLMKNGAYLALTLAGLVTLAYCAHRATQYVERGRCEREVSALTAEHRTTMRRVEADDLRCGANARAREQLDACRARLPPATNLAQARIHAESFFRTRYGDVRGNIRLHCAADGDHYVCLVAATVGHNPGFSAGSPPRIIDEDVTLRCYDDGCLAGGYREQP